MATTEVVPSYTREEPCDLLHIRLATTLSFVRVIVRGYISIWGLLSRVHGRVGYASRGNSGHLSRTVTVHLAMFVLVVKLVTVQRWSRLRKVKPERREHH